MPRRAGTIDSIKVGLGIDMSALESDIKSMTKDLNKGVEVTPKINAPSNDAVKGWLVSLDNSVNRANQRGIKVPLDFDKGIAENNFKATIKHVERSVRPIIVPVHFRADAMANPNSLGNYPDAPQGGAPSGRRGPRGGGGGGSGGPSRGQPSRGSAGSAVSLEDLEAEREELVKEMERLQDQLETIVGDAGGAPKASGKTTKPKTTKPKTTKPKPAESAEAEQEEAPADKGLAGFHVLTNKQKKALPKEERTAYNRELNRRVNEQRQLDIEAGVALPESEVRKLPKEERTAYRREENRRHQEMMARGRAEPPHRAAREQARAAEEAGPDAAGRERAAADRARTRSRSKPAAAKPLEMVDPGGVTSEEREEARRSNIGRQRDSRPAQARWDPEYNGYVQTGEAKPDSAPKRADRAEALMEELGINEQLQGQTFGSTSELFDAVLGAAKGKLGAPVADLPEGERKRRFHNLSPVDRREAIDKERAKARTILEAMVGIEQDTARTSEAGITPKLRKLAEGRIQRNLERLEEVAPGLGEAFTQRRAGAARQALLATRGIKSPQAINRELTAQKRRFSDRSRRSIDTNIEDYPAEFTLDALINSLFQEPTLKKAGGVAVADESGRGNTASKKTHKSPVRARQALAREAEAVPYPKEAFATMDRIKSVQRDRQRLNKLPQSARDKAARSPLDIVGTGIGSMPTPAATEQEEMDKAQREIKTYEKSIERKGKIRSRGVTETGATPEPRTFAELDEETKARKEQERAKVAMERRMTGRGRKRDRLPIDYSLEDVYAMMTERPFEERPLELDDRTKQFALAGSQQPMSGSLFQLLSRGMAMGGPLQQRLLQRQIQAAYDAGDFSEGQRLQKQLEQMKGGWDEPALPMSPFMALRMQGKLPPKDLGGRAGGGLLAKLFGSKNDDLPKLPIYDKPEPPMALRGGQALAAHGKGPMSPWVKDAIFNQLDPKDLTGQAMGGVKDIRTMAGLKKFLDANPDAFSRWTPSLRADMRPGATSAGLTDRGYVESGISVSPAGAGAKERASQFQRDMLDFQGSPVDLLYSMQGAEGFKRRSLYLLNAKEVGRGYDDEPLVDPESIVPLAKVRPSVFRRVMGTGPSSLSDLPSIAANAESITEVGEQGREAIVGLKGGGSFVVPNHQLSAFKKMVGMAGGGAGDDAWAETFGRSGGPIIGAHSRNSGERARHPVYYDPKAEVRGGPWDWMPFGEVRPPETPPPPVTNRGVGPAGLRILGSGLGRTHATRRGVADMRALEDGSAATLGTMSNDIQRVYVVNMPSGGVGGDKPEDETAKRKVRARTGAVPAGAPARPLAAGASRGMVSDEDMDAAETLEASLGGGSGRTDPRASGKLTIRKNTAEGAAAKFEGERRVSDLQETLDQVGINISEALQKSPVRALSVAMGQIAQTVIGGRAGILERSARARALGRRAGAAAGLLENAEADVSQLQTLLEARTGETTRPRQEAAIADESRFNEKERGELVDALDRLTAAQERVEEIRPVAERRAEQALTASQQILTPGQQLRSQAVGLGGIVVGTMTFTAAMNLSQQAIQILGDVAAKAGDQLTGFSFTAKQTAEELAGAISAASGDIKGAVAGMVASAGVPTGVDLGAIEAASGRFAGAQALQRQRDLLRSQDYYQNNQGPVVPGLGAGFGNGLFGSFIFQQQGAAELLASRFPVIPETAASRTEERAVRQEGAPLRDVFMEAALGLPAGERGVPEPYQTTSMDEFEKALGAYGTTLEDLSKLNTEQQIGKLVDIGQLDYRGTPLPPEGSDLATAIRAVAPSAAANLGAAPGGTIADQALTEARDQALEDTEIEVDRLNKSLEKIGSSFRVIEDATDLRGLKATTDALRAVGATGLADKYLNANLSIQREGGGEITGLDANQFLQDFLDSALQPTASGLMEQMRRPFQAQMDAQRRQFELQRQLIPAQAAQQLIQSPFPQSASTGVVATSGVDPAAARAAGKYTKEIQGARDALMEIRDQGLTELENLGVPDQVIQDVVDLGDEITKLRTTASNLELGLEQAQFNEQVRISLRTISDLVGLNQKQSISIGEQVVGASKLGQLQRAQINDSRELARIQLARSQRELNLQLALSRLRSPGETPEERAVRRREAELLAKSQQRELDINKRTTGRGFQIQEIEIGRQLEDAVKQFQLLQRARDVSVQVRGIQQLVQAKEQMLGVKNAYLDTAREAGVAVRRATIGLVETLESRLGRITDAQVRAVNKYVKGMVSEWDEFIRIFGLGGGTQRSGGESRKNKTQGEKGDSRYGERILAPGGMHRVSTPTRFTAGEAGTEEVIVLRNPRSGMGGPLGFNGGSNGATFNLSMTINATVSGEGDEDRLVRKIVREIHQQAGMMAG